MPEKNQQLLVDERVEVQDFKKFTNCFRGTCRIYLEGIFFLKDVKM